MSDKPDAPGGGGDQRELVARLRAVIEAKDSENAMLWAELQVQLERYRRLELRLAELERRLGSDSTTSGTPPPKDPIGPRERRKSERKARQTSEQERRADRSRGGQPGHPGAGLSRDPDPDEREEVPPPAECSRCGTTLDGADRAGSWWSQVRDVKITTFVTEYLLPLLACPRCGKINAAQGAAMGAPGQHLLRSGHQYRRGAADLLRERARRTSREPDRHAARHAGLGGVRRWRQRTAVVPAGAARGSIRRCRPPWEPRRCWLPTRPRLT